MQEVKEQSQEQIQDFANSYMDRWGIARDKDYFAIKNTKTEDWSVKKDGDVWFEEDMWYTKKDGIITCTSTKPSETVHNMLSFDTCKSCSRIIANENERRALASTGLCYSCLAKKELDDIINKKEYVRPDWKTTIVLKNSLGVPIMDINDYRTQFGDEQADKIIKDIEDKITKPNEI